MPKDPKDHFSPTLYIYIYIILYCVCIQARFQSSEETLTVYNNHISPSSSYIQISPVTALPAQVTLVKLCRCFVLTYAYRPLHTVDECVQSFVKTFVHFQIGSPLQIDVESTFEPTALHFVVCSVTCVQYCRAFMSVCSYFSSAGNQHFFIVTFYSFCFESEIRYLTVRGIHLTYVF